jgi:hypothetical protein
MTHSSAIRALFDVMPITKRPILRQAKLFEIVYLKFAPRGAGNTTERKISLIQVRFHDLGHNSLHFRFWNKKLQLL